jgi:hypothetical protein
VPEWELKGLHNDADLGPLRPDDVGVVYKSPQRSHSLSLSPSRTLSRSRSLALSRSRSLALSLALALSHSLSRSLSINPPNARALNRALSLADSLTHSLTHSPTHQRALALSRSRSLFLDRARALSVTQLSQSLPPTHARPPDSLISECTHTTPLTHTSEYLVVPRQTWTISYGLILVA